MVPEQLTFSPIVRREIEADFPVDTSPPMPDYYCFMELTDSIGWHFIWFGSYNTHEQGMVRHKLDTMVRQWVFGVAAGYEYSEAHKSELQDELKTLVDEDKAQHCLTEPDARLMRSGREGMMVGYNAQNAVDGEHQLIVHHELTQTGNDNQQLKPMAQVARDVLEGELETVIADAGYSNAKQISDLQSSSTTWRCHRTER